LYQSALPIKLKFFRLEVQRVPKPRFCSLRPWIESHFSPWIEHTVNRRDHVHCPPRVTKRVQEESLFSMQPAVSLQNAHIHQPGTTTTTTLVETKVLAEHGSSTCNHFTQRKRTCRITFYCWQISCVQTWKGSKLLCDTLGVGDVEYSRWKRFDLCARVIASFWYFEILINQISMPVLKEQYQ
jgi:hypothetical protein